MASPMRRTALCTLQDLEKQLGYENLIRLRVEAREATQAYRLD